MTDPLSPVEIDRYRRHIVLAEIGGAGQQKLKAANVLIVGAGGLGAPVIQYLAAAGIGHIGVLDDDTVSLSKLQRQVIHDTPGLGTTKIASAEAAVFEHFREHAKGRMTLLISHRFSSVRNADHIIVLDGGRILEEGSHHQLMAAGGRYAELFDVQARGYR